MIQKYKFERIIGKGVFGIIYIAKNNFTDEYVAIKKSINDDETLLNEAKIYNYLNNKQYFPTFKGFIKDNINSCLIIELMEGNICKLGNNVSHDLIKNIINQLMNGIQFIHEKGIVHRDLKPLNILISKNKIKICDFGIAKQIIFDKKHIEFKNIDKPIGSPNYYSINVHNLFEPSRRDDMESFFYIIINLNKILPWIIPEYKNLNKNNIEDIKILKNLKKNLENTDFLSNNEKKILKIIRNLKYIEKPNYDEIKNLLLKEY